ncbi:hypothetical protein [Epilithonimonas zeae]|uniref:hypothetical protein n=1 Tax=Epilithonimonas zeae TaxID=1416779 RepID=UPI00200DE2DC|nr:hypothetical protein [Epilithonimonas zeae]UQB70291.1 hypothetical protein KI430_07665 [Epilithonimonas zeae]
MKSVYVLFSIFWAGCWSAQTFQRNVGESREDFVKRIKPIQNAQIQGEVLEVKQWNNLANPIFAFYEYSEEGIEKGKPNGLNYSYVDGYLLIPSENNRYNKIFIDTYAEEGATAYVESVFFANADRDADKELGVLCSWDQSMHSGISGRIYQVYFYDFPKATDKISKLKPIQIKGFDFEFDGTNDAGERSVAKFNTAAKIKAELKRLGF